MNTKTRKALEIADREELLLDIALELMAETGFAGLTMDKITQRSQYSKGTVYNHFGCKEDVLCGLCCRSMRLQIDLYQRINGFAGSTREKMIAMAYGYRLFNRLYPTLSMVVLSMKTPNIMEKTSSTRSASVSEYENKIVGVAVKLIEEAVALEEIPASQNVDANAATFAAWSMAFGTNALSSTVVNKSSKFCSAGFDSQYALLYNINLLCDGLNWKPLSQEQDYLATWQRIGQELYSEELAMLEQNETLY
ncbi:TetR/AcrR family transcriptional regulator [Agarivorans sp. 1_MG-2023]|uniref:TetR/AcrR family transcriptional regulator n=1 Tax=Agarivorans sp. 1_MG-2023 TaxID=3062634 RepID=UPI0026E1C6F1|nr:TetR/AcrR family transcriptional regulator [Agarivorans sp. 1_MG-2023]MDO6762607.1 TetR/AcrR family transcriptional regulator [Agarivorans sp. 1_MG-2023]